ncbi:hypothetical protein G3I59_13765 [Amycolatopsis rubida]|uniref:DNA-binding phage zinc finger domain-containing protein n=1 Tax=Amycolatopsis rubida TaxID=112413 RepID=A0ABX0BMN3_9PSEU|nr:MULTISPECIES: hypothetical protein [Amycolatopsis]MYW91642.1 hypothetical protein [Amycolatopsis rubida]NEC56626.1 hypothetical protein [Amycolatopsis rubida]
MIVELAEDGVENAQVNQRDTTATPGPHHQIRMLVDDRIRAGDTRPVKWIRAQARRQVLNARADLLAQVYGGKPRASLFAWVSRQFEELPDGSPWPELPAVAPDVQARHPRRAQALEHDCPSCGASVSQPCRGSRGPRISVHKTRLDVSSA